MDKYLVVGSPGRYRVVPVKENDNDYKSGMSEQAANETAVSLNNKYFNDISKYSPTGNLTTSDNPDPFSTTGNLTTSDTTSGSNLSATSRELTNEEFKDFRNLSIEEKKEAISRYADGNIFLTTSQKKFLDETYDISNSEIKKAEDIGKSGVINIDSGPLDSGVDTWWQLLGYEGLSEVNRELASGALTMSEVNRAKDDAEEKRGMGGLEDTRTTSTQDATVSGPDEIVQTVTLFKDGKTVEVLSSDANLYLAANWTANETASSGIGNAGGGNGDNLGTGSSQEIVTSQVIVLGPNGARTTANSELSAIDKERGETRTELERLLAGDIPGREGYKDADKIDYEDTYGGHSTGESVSGDYKGDYGGEDASTPDSEKESLQGAGNTSYDTKDYSSVVTGGGATGSGQFVGQPGSNQETSFNNIPTGAKVFDVDGDYYLGYLVPGGDGSLYTGSIYMMYQVPNNDFVKSGLLTDASAFKGANSFLTKEDLNTGGAIVAGTTIELEGIEGNPFIQFVERINDNVAISPWLTTADGLALSAEVALEGRDPTPGEYRQLKWFQETTEEQRDWYELSLGRGFSNLPLDAKQAYESTRRNVKNNLLSLGIAGGFDPETGMLRDVPPGLIDYLSQKSVTGEWSESKTTEQVRLFADPFAAGERDEAFFNVVESGGYDQIDRQMQYEDTVRQEALKWLGPVAGNYNSTWVANWGSRIRSGEADAFQQLQTMLKQQRVALFDAYTNPELTYEDISQPWKNIAENAWGEIPDESQTYFQDIVKNNNVTYANEVLTKVGLEQGKDKVVNDALTSLEQSIGQGSVRRNLGANT
tara:strand:- start:838 stop:3294 length:2457 start_codon:yes stop_codon:yes gene_type:complete